MDRVFGNSGGGRMVVVSDVDFLRGERGFGFGFDFGAWKAGRGFWAMRRSNSGGGVKGEGGRVGLVVVVVVVGRRGYDGF